MKENHTFKIRGAEFGVGEVKLSIDEEAKTLSVEVIGDKETTDALTADEKGKWSWVTYPPKLYLTDVPYEASGDELTVEVDEDLLDECDVALYLAEHNDVYGKLTVEGKEIHFKGKAMLSGDEAPVEVRATSS